MKNIKIDTKKIIIAVIAVLLVLVPIISAVVIKNNNKKENNNKTAEKRTENKNSNVISNQEIEGFKISDVKVEIINGLTTFTAKATNVTSEVKHLSGFNIYFTEKSDGDMGMVTVYINGDINPNESVDLINYSDLDLTKATNIKYELIQE